MYIATSWNTIIQWAWNLASLKLIWQPTTSLKCSIEYKFERLPQQSVKLYIVEIRILVTCHTDARFLRILILAYPHRFISLYWNLFTEGKKKKNYKKHCDGSTYSSRGSKIFCFPILEPKKPSLKILPITIQITDCLFYFRTTETRKLWGEVSTTKGRDITN